MKPTGPKLFCQDSGLPSICLGIRQIKKKGKVNNSLLQKLLMYLSRTELFKTMEKMFTQNQYYV